VRDRDRARQVIGELLAMRTPPPVNLAALADRMEAGPAYADDGPISAAL
jgi:hypothetical protein